MIDTKQLSYTLSLLEMIDDIKSIPCNPFIEDNRFATVKDLNHTASKLLLTEIAMRESELKRIEQQIAFVRAKYAQRFRNCHLRKLKRKIPKVCGFTSLSGITTVNLPAVIKTAMDMLTTMNIKE